MPEPIAHLLAEFALRAEPSRDLHDVAARHVLDTVGCALAAVGLAEGGHATTVVGAAGGSAQASVVGRARRVPAAAAAFANGTRAHALDFDDTHEAGICHVSAVVAPAAIAVGESLGRSWSETLDAYLVGSETALRIAVAAAPGLYARGFHPTPIAGAFGAAAAAARLARLTPEQASNALGVVGSFASGLFEYLSDGSATKPLHAGWAAQAGVQAAALASAGATGPATIIEGRFGLLASHADTRPDLAPVTARLGEDWEAARVAIKLYPACHFAHACTWGVAELAARHALRADGVASVDVRIPAEGVALVLDPIEAKHRPATPYDAKFSLPFTVAHQLLHGDVGLTAFSSERIEDAAVLALARRVNGGDWRDGTPPSRFAGDVSVTTTRGDVLRLEVPHPPGSPGNPLDDDGLLRKFRANAGLALEASDVAAVADAVCAPQGGIAAADLIAPLRRARPQGAPIS